MSELNIVWKGEAGEVFAEKNWLSGGVTGTSESWVVTLTGSAAAIDSYIASQQGLYLGSLWSPVDISSRNTPRISGWDVGYSGQMGTLKIRYNFDSAITFKSDSGALPETKEEEIRAALTTISLSECPAIWSAAQLADSYRQIRALFVEYCKARLSIKPSSPTYSEQVANWESNFVAELAALGDTSTNPWTTTAFKNLKWCLSNGIDQYQTDTYQISVTEMLNSEPTLSGIGTYNTPTLETLSLPNDEMCKFWYQNDDSVATAPNGQFRRVRTWLGVTAKTPLYKG